MCRYTDLPSCILIADKAHRTLKYLSAIALGLPTLHYNWIKHCVEQNCLLPYKPYSLPSGFSLIKNEMLYINNAQPKVLSRVNVLVSSEHSSFVEYWAKLCKLGGATVLSEIGDTNPRNCSCFGESQWLVCCYIVSDVASSRLRTSLKRDKKQKHKIAWVSAEFIIQCLINQQILNFESNSQYSIK